MSTCTLTCVVVLPPSPKRCALLFCPLLPSGIRGCFPPFSQMDMMAAVLFFFRSGSVLASLSVSGRSSGAQFSSLGSPGGSWGLIFTPWGSRGRPWGFLGRSLGVPGGSLGYPGALLVDLWGLLEVPGKFLGGPGGSPGCAQGASGGPWAVPRVPPEMPLSVTGSPWNH